MKSLINLKTDSDIKKSAQMLAQEMGLSLSAIINAYLRQFVRSRQLYFSMTPIMAPALEKLLSQAEMDIRLNRNLSEEISSPKDLKKHFRSL